MAPKTLFFTAAAFAGAALVSAQAVPHWAYFPQACSSDCANTIEIAYLCETEYSSSTTDSYGCFCNSYPSDASGCATCLNDNNSAALASLLTSTQTACPEAQQQCFFECSFDTCASTDIACQCDGTYLENIYNCASCNTANNNSGTTQITDFNNLQQSCANQNYTGASEDFTTVPLPTATGQDSYTQPSLTATGGGEAATGDLVSGSAAATSTGAAATSKVSAAATTTSKASGSSTGSAAGSGSSTSASAAASSGAATGLAAPLTGVLAVAGAILALF